MAEKKKKKVQIPEQYNENDIQVLEGLDAVRKRPGMYIGGTGIGALHHMVYEVVDNSVDEALAGHANEINITIEQDGSVSVEDNGRGIPVGMHKKMKRSALEVIFTILHSGGKFGGNGYKVSGGLHGVGLSVVNALSTVVEVHIEREGKLWYLKLENGEPVEPVKAIGKSDKTGTKIRFYPDGSIFETTKFDFDVLAQRFKETAYLSRGLKISIQDLRKKQVKKEIYQFEGGINDLVTDINSSKEVLHKKPLYFIGSKFNEVTNSDVEMECSFQYTDDYNDNTFSYVNNIRTRDGGTHEAGFKQALTRAVNDIARKKKILKEKDKNLDGNDIREGLTCIISIKMADPQFEGQTKGKLASGEIRGLADSISSEKLSELLTDNPAVLTAIVKKAQSAAKAREAMKKSREVNKTKSTLDIAGLSGKFAKCTTKDAKEAELYLVEGDSAGGSAKQGRNRFFQAILPLRGKVINTEKNKLSKVLSNEEIKTIITAIGAGIGKEFDPANSKFHKVVIMTDADVDGEHIRTLLLTFFFRFMRPLIDEGYLYIAQPPLYKIEHGKKEVEYAFSDKERDSILESLGNKKYSIQRYKGLGEMNADQLWETTMDPETRSLIRIRVEDAIYADKVFELLMGDKVEPRRAFIEEHANEAEIDFSNG